ncbi:MAG: NUDIX domain-containing protein [Candidatus Doudnabacteria bacterium]|nr:NUDIX domain-containing protein [Candidatus Doudnabacteria bacterium]
MPEEKPKWKREISAGGVVYKKENNLIFILLIMPKGPNFGPPVGYWTFPKGLLDHDGEDKEEVAVREVKEEGGVEAGIKQELGMAKYFRKSEYFGNAIKFVHFYLMEYVSGDPGNHDEEVAEAGWFPLEEVPKKLKFPHDKEIFEKSVKALHLR